MTKFAEYIFEYNEKIIKTNITHLNLINAFKYCLIKKSI